MNRDHSENPGADMAVTGLDEFVPVRSTGLAPFEEESTILLDDFSSASPYMLEEFEESREIIEIEEVLGSTTQEDDGSPEEPVPSEGDGEAPERDAKEAGDEQTFVEMKTPLMGGPPEFEEEPVDQEPPPALPPESPVIGFVCEHAVDMKRTMDDAGRMKGREIVHLIALPCAGMVKPEWLALALERGASGAFVIACDPGACHHRTGSCILDARWIKERRPMLRSSVDRQRVRLFQFHRAAWWDLVKQVDMFLEHLGWLDSQSPPERPDESKPAGSVFDTLM